MIVYPHSQHAHCDSCSLQVHGLNLCSTLQRGLPLLLRLLLLPLGRSSARLTLACLLSHNRYKLLVLQGCQHANDLDALACQLTRVHGSCKSAALEIGHLKVQAIQLLLHLKDGSILDKNDGSSG